LDFKRIPLYIHTWTYVYSLPTCALPSGTLTVVEVGEPLICVCYESHTKGTCTVYEVCWYYVRWYVWLPLSFKQWIVTRVDARHRRFFCRGLTVTWKILSYETHKCTLWATRRISISTGGI
jgi:hypothetical protein